MGETLSLSQPVSDICIFKAVVQPECLQAFAGQYYSYPSSVVDEGVIHQDKGRVIFRVWKW